MAHICNIVMLLTSFLVVAIKDIILSSAHDDESKSHTKYTVSNNTPKDHDSIFYRQPNYMDRRFRAANV